MPSSVAVFGIYIMICLNMHHLYFLTQNWSLRYSTCQIERGGGGELGLRQIHSMKQKKKSWTSIPVVRWSQFHPSRQVHPENQNHIFGSETPRKIWNIYLKITVTAWDAKMCFRLKKKKIKYSTNKELLLPGKKKAQQKTKNRFDFRANVFC